MCDERDIESSIAALTACAQNEDPTEDDVNEFKKRIKKREEDFKKELLSQIADDEFLARSYNL